MDILIATNNRHKKEEIARILRGHTILLPEEIGASFDYHEPFDTFHENAFGKGMTMFRQTGEGCRSSPTTPGSASGRSDTRPGSSPPGTDSRRGNRP
jgi:hypothetical protein